MASQALLILFLSVLSVLPCQSFTTRTVPKRSHYLNFASRGSAPSQQSYAYGCAIITSSLQSTDTTTTTDRDILVQDLLTSARNVGQVGSLASAQDQEMLVAKARKLANFSDPNPAQVSLHGVHNLVYSAAPGGSSGRLAGPLYGKVRQTFLEDGIFINSVEFGPLKIALKAKCKNKNETTNAVTFQETSVSLFGNELVKKELNGGGVWKYLFLGEVQDVDGSMKLVRVMETPSLFIIEQPIYQ